MLVSHTGPVNCIQFYENGKLLATGSNDKTICIWDSAGCLVRQNQVHSAPVLALHWAKNGIYSGGSDFLLKYSFFNCTNIEEPAELCWLVFNRSNNLNNFDWPIHMVHIIWAIYYMGL